MSQKPFRVIIVGGSVTGLTLAHSLHRIGVDYIILEKRAKVVLQEGASIGILPNGARVLDQLGLYDTIEQSAAPPESSHIHFPDGFHFISPYPKRMLESFGYPIAFLERRRLLEILYNTLPDKTRLKVNKTVSDIEQYPEGGKCNARVRTLDGDVYEGDLVVGADGVHSRTRREMWRLSGSSSTGDVPVSERNTDSLFQGLSGLSVGQQVMRIYNGRTLLVVPSKDELVFWFLSQKLDRKYEYSNAPRFTLEDAAAQCLQVADAPIADGIQFQDIWKMRQAFNMVSLEENLFKTWSFGPIVCIGDSMHKMTINFGQGANCAIEDVAVLSNLIHALLLENKGMKPTSRDIEVLLRRFNRIHLSRVSHIFNMSWLVARVHAQDGWLRKIIGR
ncbi:hypothetical protein FPSE_10836 [Fusarium pseudograminearum CS3096]|uniref:FAD-binding domain-containing protein n=1 Tax=Fusarium pseudograminearum (strain CS3096) TaxID=1028729 RepID=K3V6J8_FUSPC|nr:hypothetical protein FPSE_10836 [Fusarium pseudograminearum CS3096]EKJ68992.1 hypothetical protein FPSE_10836 [Fusarium pseudograminearum CS3096]